MSEQTVKCPICGRPYVVYPMCVGDQSACPQCRDEARAERMRNVPEYRPYRPRRYGPWEGENR